MIDNTLIENLHFENITQKNKELEFKDENLQKIILDLSLEQEFRVKAFEKYYTIHNNNSIELMSQITGMYQFSGSKNLQNFLYSLCFDSCISSFLKLESAKSLLSFYEMEEVFKKDDDKKTIEIKKESTNGIIKRNKERREKGYVAFNHVCANLQDIATPCRIEAICTLMECELYKNDSDTYFRKIINDMDIDCDYRYKTILSLENNKSIIYVKFFMKNAFFDFLFNEKNRTLYRILSGQYILQKFNSEINIESQQSIENVILSFAEDNLLDYNLRADAADMLLNLGSDNVKLHCREIITMLGSVYGNAKTIFENAQNVHTTEIENSVSEIIEFLSTYPTQIIKNNPIDFEYVSDKIKNILKDEITCKNPKCEDDENKCSEECKTLYNKHSKIKLSLNRIYMDRALYSKYNSSLINILIKIWSYTTESEFKDEMILRLLQELEEMSGTCSSGFCSRLVNVISGFGDLSIRISIEDQIVSNFTVRLNALARKIAEPESIYYKDKLNDVVELWLNANLDKKKKIVNTIKKTKKLTELPPMKKIIEEFLKIDRDNKIETCVEDFSENVINEMTIDCHRFANRQNFLLFFRTHMLSIREEMYLEFKDLVTDSEFDLWIRKAISTYEGVNFMI